MISDLEDLAYVRKLAADFCSKYKKLDVLIMKPAQGAENSVYAASAKELSLSSGKFFIKKKIVAPQPVTEDQKLATKLWNIAAQKVGLN